MNIYTAAEIATLLKVDYKTVLHLLKRGTLQALPGLRHKRITEAELNRYLGLPTGQPAAGTTSPNSVGPARPAESAAATPPARPPGSEPVRDKSLVGPTAKAVAKPVAW